MKNWNYIDKLIKENRGNAEALYCALTYIRGYLKAADKYGNEITGAMARRMMSAAFDESNEEVNGCD